MRVPLLVRVLALAALAACGKPSSKKVTVASTSDATQPIVDEDFRFRLARPGDGWKVMGEEEVRNVCPDAVAGAFHKDTQIIGVVIVEPAQGADLEKFASAVVDRIALEEKRVELLERTTYAGKDAMRSLVSGLAAEIRVVYGGMIFFHDDHAYQVLAWRAGSAPPNFADFEVFHGAFSLTEGPVAGRRRRVETRDTSGVGWRVAGGVFESCVAGIRVAPTPPWRVVVGGELDLMDALAEVGLVHESPDVYVVLVPDRAPAGSVREAVERQWREVVVGYLGAATEGQRHAVPLPRSGETMSLDVLTVASPMPQEFLFGVRWHASRALKVLAWYAPAQRAEARAVLAGGLDSVQPLGAERTKALRDDLLAGADPENAIGDGWSLRSGVYRDFSSGVEWKKPKGFWRVSAGAGARLQNEDATLHMVEAERGLEALVILEDAAEWTAEDFHRAIVENMFDKEASEPAARTIGGAAGHVATGEFVIEGMTLRCRVATTVHRGVAAQLLVWAFPEVLEAEGAAVDAAIDGFRFGTTNPQREEGGRFHDLRFGYTIKPPAGWRRKDTTPPAVASIGNFMSWESGGSMVGVLALCAMAEGQNEAWFRDLVDQMVRDAYAGLVSGSPVESDVMVSGRKARRVSWRSSRETVDVDLVVRDRTIYGVFAAGKRGDRAPLEAAARSFALTE